MEQKKDSPAAASKTRCQTSFGGMCWPMPGERINEIQWKMRYASETLSRSDLLIAASVLSAYGALLEKPTESREEIVSQIMSAK